MGDIFSMLAILDAILDSMKNGYINHEVHSYL